MATLPHRGAGALLAVPALLLAVSGCSFSGHVSSGPVSSDPTSPPPSASTPSVPAGPSGSPGASGPSADPPTTAPTRTGHPTASGPTKAGPTTAARTSAPAAGGRPATASSASGAASGAVGAGAPGGPASQAGPPTCPTSVLQVSVGGDGGGGGAAGSVGTAVDFVNTGTTACVLDGHPGVSYVAGDDGHQVGAAAARDASALARVVLAPGGRARASLRIVSYHDYDDATCRPTPVAGYRIYPPDQTAARFVAQPGTACADPSVVLLTVGAVRSGSATP